MIIAENSRGDLLMGDEDKYMVLSADEIVLLWQYVDNDEARFRKLFEYLKSLPQPSRSYTTIHNLDNALERAAARQEGT